VEDNNNNRLLVVGLTAGEKLEITGVKLVQDQSGMEIDEDEVLRHLLSECYATTLMLLGDGETWKPIRGIFNTQLFGNQIPYSRFLGS